MDALGKAEDYADQFEHAHRDVADTRPAIMWALVAIAQELWHLNVRADREARSRYPKMDRREGEPRTLS